MKYNQSIFPLLLLFLSMAFHAAGETPSMDEKTAFAELQQIAAKPASYTSELGNRVCNLVTILWKNPRFRHQTTTLIDLNGGAVDAMMNRSFREELDEKERDLPNFSRVDRHLFRGGQPSETGFRQLQKLGVKTIINLRAEDHSEEALIKSLGLRFVWIPVPDATPASPAQIEAFLQVMRNKENDSVNVHCAAGVNRTGTMVALWRIEQGMSNQAALAEAVKFGFNKNILSCDRIADLLRRYQPSRKRCTDKFFAWSYLTPKKDILTTTESV